MLIAIGIIILGAAIDLQNPESDLFVIKSLILDNGIFSEFDLTSSFDAFLDGEFRVRDERMNAIHADLEVILGKYAYHIEVSLKLN